MRWGAQAEASEPLHSFCYPRILPLNLYLLRKNLGITAIGTVSSKIIFYHTSYEKLSVCPHVN